MPRRAKALETRRRRPGSKDGRASARAARPGAPRSRRREDEPSPLRDAGESLLAAWRTNARASEYLVEQMPEELWAVRVPGSPRRTVGTIASHIHNARCMWLRTLGRGLGIPVPESVAPRSVTRRQLVVALQRSGRAMEALLELGIAADGRVPDSKTYVWRNLPLDVGHVLAYFVAHEGHHRGQIVLLARQTGHRLPRETVAGLWQWTRFQREVRSARRK